MLLLAVAGSTSLSLLIVRLLVSHVLMPSLERMSTRAGTAEAGTDLTNLHTPDPAAPDSKPAIFGIAIQALRVYDSLASIFRYLELSTIIKTRWRY